MPEAQDIIRSPYPWFGGKARIAPLVWDAFGQVKNYVEPFFGGGAVLLRAPWPSRRTETVNDINAWLCNFWRAVKADPDIVAYHAADPVSELDLHARGDWLFYRSGVDMEFIERLRTDPDYFDARSAGWFVWGQSSWIGDAWGRKECRSIPHLSDAGNGVNRQLPHLGDAGKGVNPDETTRLVSIRAYMRQLSERMAGVRVCCGDWARVMGPAITIASGTCGVFLDPPYAVEDRDSIYGEHEDRNVAHDVREWCRKWGAHPLMRIVLCGYDGEHNDLELAGWSVVAWKARGGYANQGVGDNQNRHRERLWLSPHCLKQESLNLED